MYARRNRFDVFEQTPFDLLGGGIALRVLFEFAEGEDENGCVVCRKAVNGAASADALTRQRS